jgi:ADP-heptose:LPS heptosyltransferase
LSGEQFLFLCGESLSISLRVGFGIISEQTDRKIFGTKAIELAFLWRLGHRRYDMKKLLISTLATALVVSFAVSAEAAGNKQRVSADVQASCKAQAAKKYSAIHFMKRHNFVNNCIAQHAKANAPKAAKPATTGQAPKQAQ